MPDCLGAINEKLDACLSCPARQECKALMVRWQNDGNGDDGRKAVHISEAVQQFLNDIQTIPIEEVP